MAVDQQERDNITKWEGKTRGFYEAYFVQLYDPVSHAALWLRYTLLVPKNSDEPGEASLWAIFYGSQEKQPLAIKETFSLAQTVIERDIFYFEIGPAAIFNSGARGQCTSGGHVIEWDVHGAPNTTSLYHYPNRLLYHLPLPKTKYLAPNWNVRYRGFFKVDGKTFHLEGVPGEQAHLWGSNYAARWVWGHCHHFEGAPDVFFEGLTAQVRVGKKVLPPVSLFFFQYEGRLHSINGWSEVWRTKSEWGPTHWSFVARSGDLMFLGSLSRRLDRMVGLTYTDPDGSKRCCHSSLLADAEITIKRRGKSGWHQIVTLQSLASSVFETVGDEQNPAVTVWI